MAFNTQEQEIIKWGLENGKTKQDVQSAISNYRMGITPKKQEQKPEGYSLGELGQDISQTGQEIYKSAQEAQTQVGKAKGAWLDNKQGFIETSYQTLGATAKLMSNAIGSIFKGAVKAVLPQSAETAIKGGVEKAINPIAETQIVKNVLQKYNSLDERTKRNIDAALGLGSLGLDIATMGGANAGTKRVLETGSELAIKGIKATEEAIDLARSTTKNLIEKSTPKITATEAVKSVLQGTTKDVKSGFKAFSAINTTGIKTSKELETALTNGITDLSLQVDRDLAKDTTRTLLKDLVVKQTTSAGKIVTSNPIKSAMNQLLELYNNIGDKLSASEVKNAMKVAEKYGLTKIEINDLARVYGEEFSNKAFNKLGTPLTSVNAQLYENTRKQLKNIARSGIKGAEAKVADETISSLYRVRNLVRKNIEAANKLQQKIKERGLLEKITYGTVKGLDVFSGGTIRGIIGGLLPRGVGYKVMNAIDIEKALGENLKIIQEAINSGTDAEMLKILGKIK